MARQEGKSLEEILSPQEIGYLFEMMNHIGWSVMKKVHERVKEDWISQTADLSLTDKNDEELLRTIRHRHGQIKGVELFLSYLEKKKASYGKEQKTART